MSETSTPQAPHEHPENIRLVASDVDGTLLQRFQPIPQATVEAVNALVAAGVDFVPVTGRPVRWLAPLQRDLPIVRHVICANGSIVYNLQRDEVVHAHLISTEVQQELISRVRAHMPEAKLAFETLDAFCIEPGFVTRWPQEAVTIDPAESRHIRQVAKIMVRGPSTDSDAMLAAVSELIGDALHATHSNPTTGLIELAAAGVTKAHTLAEYCQRRGIDADDVAAFGDMPNDIEMLTWAGWGYAMADGHPTTLAAARAVAPAVHDGGITEAIRAFAAAAQRRTDGGSGEIVRISD